MLLILGTLLIGVVIGVIAGGRIQNLAEVRFRWWGLPFLAVALQFAPVPAGPSNRWIGAAFLIASYAAVIAFVWLNIRIPGLWVIALGFALNLVVVGINGGMPVGDHALRVAYGDQYREQRRQLEAGETKHHLARPDDVLSPLTDVIPIGPPIRQVYSAGDVIWLLGTMWLVAGLTREPMSAPGSRAKVRQTPNAAP